MKTIIIHVANVHYGDHISGYIPPSRNCVYCPNLLYHDGKGYDTSFNLVGHLVP
jgi:hypothetical protein